MEQKKVQLPRAVAEALEKLGKRFPKDFILWHSSREDYPDTEDAWKTIHEFVDISDAIFTLADALRYGYVIDEPITVEITAEQQKQIRDYYESVKANLVQFPDKMLVASGEHTAIMKLLDILGIKIDGVNA